MFEIVRVTCLKHIMLVLYGGYDINAVTDS